MSLGNMKIGLRLGLGFGLVLALMIAMVFIGAGNMSKIEGNLERICNVNNVKINLAHEMMNSMDVISQEIRTVLLLEDPGAKQQSNKKIQDAREKYGKAFEKLKNMEKNAEGQALLSKLENVISEAKSANNQVIELGMANKTAEAIPVLIKDSLPGMTKISAALEEVVKYQEGQSKISYDEAASAYNGARMLMFLLGGIALVLGILIAFFIARSIANPVRKLTAVADKLALGDVNVEIEAKTNDEIGMLSRSFKTMAENIKGSAIAAQKVAEGDLDVDVKIQSDHDILGKNLSVMVKTIKDLLKETQILIQAIREGKLDTRGNASRFAGGWGEMVGGINTLVDAFVGPFNVTAEYVERISKGDLPPKITDTYYGDFNEIKNNLNTCIGSITTLVAEVTSLIQSAVEGRLDRRADVDNFEGDYRRIVQGVNDTLDAVIRPLNVAAEYVDRISKGDIPEKITDTYHGDFNEIKNNLNRCIDGINGLVKESLMLSGAAVEGRLQVRGDAGKFEGSFRNIIQGVNDTLNAVIDPVNEAAECLKEMAQGNLEVRVTGKYQGDHAIIKEALNTTLKVLNDILKQETVRCLQEIAKGNLNVAVTGQYQGDYAIIKEALNTSISELNEILSQVSVAIDQVSAGSRQVSDASQVLSEGAAESASSMEQITASMQEINAQTRQNADNAVQANQLATEARSNAEKGNEQMAHMVRAMNDINESASNISKIIKAIDEIAFQTNLLALNAAVEAARAGKHGKGFTVVAEEVRNLAQRSAKAAKETAEMIEGSIKKTEVGTRIAEATSGALEEIVLGVTKITDLISEIASASKEQALGIGQINQGLNQMDQVTQQNSANSEELASASEEMSSQALQVQEMLGRFKLQRHGENFAAGGSGRYQVSQRRVQHPEGRNYMQNEAKTSMAEAAATLSTGADLKPEDIISLDDTDYGKF